MVDCHIFVGFAVGIIVCSEGYSSSLRSLFTLLDFDMSGSIAPEEFLAGCHRLKGEARAQDMALMQYEVRSQHKLRLQPSDHGAIFDPLVCTTRAVANRGVAFEITNSSQ